MLSLCRSEDRRRYGCEFSSSALERQRYEEQEVHLRMHDSHKTLRLLKSFRTLESERGKRVATMYINLDKMNSAWMTKAMFIHSRVKDEDAKKNFNEFVKHSIKNLEGNSNRYDRLFLAVIYMNAEKVFQISAMTGSEIVFFNRETLDLLINSEQQIHPRAVDQLGSWTESEIPRDPKRDTGPNAKCDLQEIMELTQQRTGGTLDKKDYQDQIKPVLKHYQMITQTEIEAVKDLINSQYRKMPEGELKNRIDSLAPAEAYRMRTVLNDVPKDGFQLATKMAERYGDTSIPILAAFVEIVKKANYDDKKIKKKSKVLYDPKAMSIEDWSEFYKTRQQKEIAGMIHDGVEELVAEQKAAEHLEKLMKAKKATLDFRTMREAPGESAEKLEDAEERMKKAEREIGKKEAEYNKYHDQTPSEWLQERNTGIRTRTRNYILELLENGEAFDSKLAEITEGVTEAEKWLKQELAFHNSLVAYYHVLKHGDDTRHYSNILNKEEKDNTHNSDLYFKTMKNYIFELTDETLSMKKYSVISQDGQWISTICQDENGYFGVTKCTYDAYPERQSDNSWVATHFPKGNAQEMARKHATQQQRSNNNQ